MTAERATPHEDGPEPRQIPLALVGGDGAPRLGDALMGSTVGMALVGLDGRWLDVNPALCELLGYDRAALLARGWQDVTPPEDVEAQLALVAEIAAGRTDHFQNRKRYLRRDGAIVHADLSVTAIREGPGAPYNVAQLVDVSDLVAALSSLAESETTLARAEAAAHVGHWTWVPPRNGEAPFPVWSPEAYRIFGLDPAGPALDLDSMRSLLSPASIAASFAAIERVLADHQPYVVEIEFERPGGSAAWAEIRGAPELAADGSVTRLVGLLVDVTQRKRHELALAASREEFAEAQRVGQIGSFTWDPVSQERTWSPEMYRLYGREPGSAVPTRDETSSQMDPDEFATLNAAVADALRTGEPYEVEYDLRGLDGIDRRVLARGEVVDRPNGSIETVRGTLADITELAVARTALAASELRYRMLVENTGDIVFRSSPEAVIEWISPSVERVLGYPPSEFVGRRTAEIVHPDDRERFRAAAASVNHQGRASYEARFRRADGSWCWCWVVAAPIVDGSGSVIGRTGVVRDIDDVVRQREELQSTRGDMVEAQRLAHAGSWTWDPRTDRVEWSAELFRIVGRDPAGPAPGFAEQSAMYEPADYELLTRLLARAIATGEPYEAEVTILRPEGSRRTAIARGAAVLDPDGAVAFIRGTLVDVTEQAARREARARHLVERSDYLDRAEHTMRTQLTVVEGWAEAIGETADTMDPDTLRRAAAAIGRNAASLTRLMHGLMVEAGETARAEALEPVPVDVAAIAAQVVAELGVLDSGRSLTAAPDHGVVAMGSEEAVATVVGHLVENALKFAGAAGSIEVEVRRSRRGTVELSVTDDGPGIPEGLHLFEAFAKSGAHAGHGLGLHVVRSLVDAMGGEVTVEPRPDGGHGARFVVTLRAA